MSKAININSVRESYVTKEATPNKEATPKREFFLTRIINNYSAKKQAKKIMKALDEAKKIEAGKKPSKSFDDFLSEL